ncbi:MAG: hypothetical protein WC998_04775 [Candidatus Paceibacterota bacterium]|jgi:hypothetical protein
MKNEIEKQITEIWAKLGYVIGYTEEDCIKEIASLFDNMYPPEFVEWLIFGDHLFSDINNKWIHYKSISDALNDEEGIIMTTKEVYNYWQTEIKKGE